MTINTDDKSNFDDNEQSLQELLWSLSMSEGQFSLVLARCNYEELREVMMQRLRRICPFEIKEIVLAPCVVKLYSVIREELGDEQPGAVMVFGLESVSEIEQLLIAMNSVREEFRKSCHFPLVLWVNDEILCKLMRLAPDFESWTTRAVFSNAPDVLLEALRQRANRLFSAVLEAGAYGFLPTEAIFSTRYRLELQSALRDLHNYGERLAPELEACLQFVRGRESYVSDRIGDALAYYQRSLTFWQASNYLERQAALLFHIGLCHCRRGQLAHTASRSHWQKAVPYFQQCLELFENRGRLDLVAKFIGQLGEVLRQLQDWQQLQRLAEKSLRLHESLGKPATCLAQDYGFLAEVALQRQNWSEAEKMARKALHTL
ncbi:MAG: tetratricopeptide repeat protein, partial [Coleofasciculaceae cyanobacterium]